jgi:hypothetical protein
MSQRQAAHASRPLFEHALSGLAKRFQNGLQNGWAAWARRVGEFWVAVGVSLLGESRAKRKTDQTGCIVLYARAVSPGDGIEDRAPAGNNVRCRRSAIGNPIKSGT